MPAWKSVLSLVVVLVLIFSGASSFAQQKDPAKAGKQPASQSLGAIGTQPVARMIAPPAKSLPKPLTVGVLCPNLADPYFVNFFYGVESEAKKYNLNLQLRDAGGYPNVDVQIKQAEDFIAGGVHALVLAATQGDALVPVVESAVSKKIPVVNIISFVKTDKVVTKIAQDQWELGSLQAQYMAKNLKGKGKVGMIKGTAGTSWAIDRAQGFKDEIAKYPDIKIVAEQWNQPFQPDAMRLAEDYLQKFPDLNGIYTAGNLQAWGAIDALRAAGKAGKITVTTSILLPKDVELIQEGVLSMSAAHQVVLIGRLAVRAVVRQFTGEGNPPVVLLPSILFSKENISNVDWSNISAPKGYVPRR